MIVNVDICILGGGPTALILAGLLKEQKKDFLLITKKMEGALLRLDINSQVFNPIPVFPVLNSYVYNRLKLADLCTHNDILSYGYSVLEKPDSFSLGSSGSAAATLYQVNGEKAVVLSRKQFGEIVMTEPLHRLQQKVSKHYSLNGQKFSRLGFSNGISAYLTYIANQYPFPVIHDDIIAIKPEVNLVETESAKIHYRYLIPTIPLPELLVLAKLDKDLFFTSTGAQFYVFETETNSIPNKIIYDCNINSCIYRVFIPHKNFISVQLARDYWNVESSSVASRVKKLLATDILLNYKNKIELLDCYPLDVQPMEIYKSISMGLREMGIYLFGRSSQWDYLDLHELQWEMIDELTARLPDRS